MDFTFLDGRGGPRALCVRDLASGKSLHAAVVDAESADCATDALAGLFAEHGAPSVIKSDNGGAFRSQAMAELLRTHRVLLLLSPPRTPSYNGSCETSIGGLKRVATDLCVTGAARHGLGDFLDDAATILDLQTAGRYATASTRLERWRTRPPCTSRMRERLARLRGHHERRARAERGIAPEAASSDDQRVSLDRFAIREALCQMDLLHFQRP